MGLRGATGGQERGPHTSPPGCGGTQTGAVTWTLARRGGRSLGVLVEGASGVWGEEFWGGFWLCGGKGGWQKALLPARPHTCLLADKHPRGSPAAPLSMKSPQNAEMLGPSSVSASQERAQPPLPAPGFRDRKSSRGRYNLLLGCSSVRQAIMAGLALPEIAAG